jgi:transcriptional regulator with XRE-family HTH domain
MADLFRLGTAMREYRVARGLTLKDVADVVGISESGLSRWEHGRNRPGAPELRRLAIALGVRPENWLLLAGYIDAEGQWLDEDAPPPDPLTSIRAALLAGGWERDVRRSITVLLKATRPTI